MSEEKCNVCGNKNAKLTGLSAHHSENLKKQIVTRLNRIEGQIRGISRMIGDDVYCDDILNQITSINSALGGVKKLLLEAHLKSCVVEQVQNGKIEVMDELLNTIGRMLK
jgi:DNA-binding FrmR family transcriptional regulator